MFAVRVTSFLSNMRVRGLWNPRVLGGRQIGNDGNNPCLPCGCCVDGEFLDCGLPGGFWFRGPWGWGAMVLVLVNLIRSKILFLNISN